jgi:hypothetical protein
MPVNINGRQKQILTDDSKVVLRMPFPRIPFYSVSGIKEIRRRRIWVSPPLADEPFMLC